VRSRDVALWHLGPTIRRPWPLVLHSRCIGAGRQAQAMDTASDPRVLQFGHPRLDAGAGCDFVL